MIKQRSTLFLGIFIFVIPFLGLPTSWRASLVMIAGLGLIALSIKITLPRRLAKSGKKLRRKEKVSAVFVENMPIESIPPQAYSARTLSGDPVEPEIR